MKAASSMWYKYIITFLGFLMIIVDVFDTDISDLEARQTGQLKVLHNVYRENSKPFNCLFKNFKPSTQRVSEGLRGNDSNWVNKIPIL